MASALTSLLNASGSPVTASSNGDVITLTAKVTGSGSNYSLSASSATTETQYFSGSSYGPQPSGSTLTGGEDTSTIYDAGTVSITVNGNVQATVNYASGSTGTAVASALASALSGSLVTATASGNVVHITSVATGVDTNYTLSATSQSSNPSLFSPPSFTTATSGSTLTGGTDAHDISGAAYTLSIGYSGNSNVISAQDSVNGNWTYAYDPMNRLVTSACAGNSTAKCPDNTATEGYSYLYDRFGNRWQQNLAPGSGPGPQPQYSFDANSHMIGQSYDAAGNVLNDGMHTYVYDAENRIIQVDGGSTAVYTYDAEGRRVRKVAGTTVDYVYDHAGREIAEVNTSGGWTRQEVHVGGRHLATYSGTTTYFHNADWLGTERVRTDVNGNLYETCQGLPYGDGQACVGGEVTPMHHTGKHRDTETNLDDFPARYYSSTQGRWLTADWSVTPEPVPYAKLGNPQSLNLYAYVNSDPTNHEDPDGHSCYDRSAGGCDPGKQAQNTTLQTAEKALDTFNGTVGLHSSNCAGGGDCLNALGMAATAVVVALASDGGSEAGFVEKQIATAGTKIENIETKLLTSETLQAAEREVNGGMKVLKETGQAFDHAGKVEQAIAGLNKQASHLERVLQRSGLSESHVQTINGLIERARGLAAVGLRAITPKDPI
jgi:RHS repeat-associated protein